ncbi:CKLF-like MARVEL transmembrane domain-containing protein 7 isoform X1 [Carassius gibelio]|uniref:CKLF-like MARVEL transmembrane domain-containing protein 7 isoform X1 n=1 Tax=Carassius gibelio TaxID=101364 RepID=UPI0022785566|nr:CKLF-like MARVEL transmembrane domain-containing protein 7 isoform X1 [Carassius gibelio]
MMGFLFLEYLRSKQGILKLAQLVILLVAFACVRSTWYNSLYAYGFFEGVTLGYCITVSVFLILTVFGVPKRTSFVNWKITEFVLDTLGFIFISTGSIVAAVKTYDTPILVAASVCGLLASYLSVVSVLLSFVAARSSQPEGKLGSERFQCVFQHI